MEIRIPIDSAYVLFGASIAIAAVIWHRVRSLTADIAAQREALQARLKSSGISRIESCEQRIDELAVAIGDVANRVKMQRVRNAANHVDDSKPSSNLDKLKEKPEEWRAAMNRKLATRTIGATGDD